MTFWQETRALTATMLANWCISIAPTSRMKMLLTVAALDAFGKGINTDIAANAAARNQRKKWEL
jgi:hypothetical protein